MNRTSSPAQKRERVAARIDCLECVGGVYVGTTYPTCHKCGHGMPTKLQAVFAPPAIVVLVA